MAKLNQIIAIEKGVKSQAHSKLTELYRAIQKIELFHGFNKEYQKNDEADQNLPKEGKRVTLTTDDALRTLERIKSEEYNVTARKDYTNCVAMADVMLDGNPLIKNAPVTFLLYLEKELTAIRDFVMHLPTQDPAEKWSKNDGTGLYESEVTSTHRTKKVTKPIVLYPATPEHPAQTQLIAEDVLAGYWNTKKFTGSMPQKEKEALLERVDSLLKSVKQAREHANMVDEVNINDIGGAIFRYLLG